MNENYYDALAVWIDSIFDVKRPDDVAAFHFNLYETTKTYDLQLIGAPTYDAIDSDWACDDILKADNPFFELPHVIVGGDWQTCLKTTVEMLLRYLNSEHSGAARLNKSNVVSIGFIDGDIRVLWPESSGLKI